MGNHEALDALLDDLNESEVGTREYARANMLITAYYNQAMMLNDNTIGWQLILKTYRISSRKIGIIATVKAVLSGIRIAISDLRK